MGPSRNCYMGTGILAIFLSLVLVLSLQNRSQLQILLGPRITARDDSSAARRDSSSAHASESRFSISSPYYVPWRRQPCAGGGAEKRGKVRVDNAKALPLLEIYQPIFAEPGENISGVDPNKIETVKTWWQAGAIMEWYTKCDLRYQCLNITKVGNWRICQDHPYTVKAPCLVYSFGINRDFSFDNAMAKLGCEVHSFDPSNGMKDHKRGPKFFFWSIGLGSSSTNAFQARLDVYVRRPQTWKIRTLSAVKEMLGHSERVIDVLKMDIEGYEWAVLRNLIETGELTNVRQFSLEFHTFPKFPAQADYIDNLKAYTKLREDLGFLEYSVHPHKPRHIKGSYNVQGDSQFVNSFFNYGS